MSNKRIRTRIPLGGIGEGKIVETGQRFAFEAKDFSVAGLQILVIDGQIPGLGETVHLSLDVESLEGDSSALTLSGTIRRVEVLEEGAMCGVRLEDDMDAEAGAILEDAYLERYFDTLE